MAATDDPRRGTDEVLRPLPRALPRVRLAPRSRPGRTGADVARRARSIGRSLSVRSAPEDDTSSWYARPRWVDVETAPRRRRFEPPITGDAAYDALIRAVRRRRAASRSPQPSPGPGLPRASARKGTRAGGGTGPGEGGRRLDQHPVQPVPSPAIGGITASTPASLAGRPSRGARATAGRTAS